MPQHHVNLSVKDKTYVDSMKLEDYMGFIDCMGAPPVRLRTESQNSLKYGSSTYQPYYTSRLLAYRIKIKTAKFTMQRAAVRGGLIGPLPY